MGQPCHTLVPVAILFDNPQGLTKEEYLDLLGQVHVSPSAKFMEDDPWDSYSEKYEGYYRGPKNLAKALELGLSEQYQEFQEPSLDSTGLIINPPRYIPLVSLYRRIESFETYHVVVCLGNEVGRSIKRRRGHKVQTPEEVMKLVFENWEMERLVKDEYARRIRGAKEQFPGEDPLSIQYEYRGEIIDALFRVETYETEEELWQRWPQFHPDNKYNFNQEGGSFNVYRSQGNFLWKFRDGRYFFDPETLNRIPASWKASGWETIGYTDIVVTAEAIRHGAWKLFSRRGFDYMDDFLRDFPQSQERLEQAIQDSHTLLSAEGRGIPYREALRERLTPWAYRPGKER